MKSITRKVNRKTYKIDFGIEKPSSTGTWKSLIEEMDPAKDASIFFTKKTQAIMLCTLMNRLKFKGTMRRTDRGYRVWRIK